MLFPQNRWSDQGPVKGGIARLLCNATRVSTPVAVTLTVAALLIMALVDDAIGTRWPLGLFYYLPIAFGAWRLGRTFGVVAGLLCALAWWAAATLHVSAPHMPFALMWGFISRALSFGVVAALVAEMRELFERERGLARHCHLTGALSGRAFRDLLDAVVVRAARRGHGLALVYLDLDDFKVVNDLHGHGEGDARLRAFAESVMAAIGPDDYLARTGGDEFVILLTGHDGAERHAIDRARAAAAAALGAGVTPISASMGAVIVPAGMRADAGDLVRRADAAMYEGKRAGKGRLCVFDLGAPPPLSVAA